MQLIAITAALATIASAVPTVSKRDNFQGRFTLRASKPGAPFDGQKIEAAGQHFFIGPSGPATYCPVQVGSSCPPGTETVLVNGAMVAEVPGGQQTFVQNSGAFAFSQAHSGALPDLYSQSTAAGSDLVYRGPWGVDWAACPVNSTNGKPTWQVYAEIPSFNKPGCTCFQAKVFPWSGGIGAWQYT